MNLQINRWSELSVFEQQQLLQRPAEIDDAGLRDQVRAIVAAVRTGGDAEVNRRTLEFDGVDVHTTKVSASEFSAAEKALSTAQKNAIELAIRNVRKFHEAQIPIALDIETMPGVRCERISHPLGAVGLYVPAGTAPLPSTAVMLATPAALAACPVRVMCTPPRPDGQADPSVLVAARRAGIESVFKIGGVQAIAAMAYGTATVPKVDKIFGPGNSRVTEAKLLVAADPSGAAIDMPAGPSEVLIIADAAASAEFIAADLLSQAEHGSDSQTLLITPSAPLAGAVIKQIEQQLQDLSRQVIAQQALQHCRMIIADDIAAAVKISNRYAPEHLILQTSNARDLLAAVRNAGSVFIGQWSPEAVGDYCSGTNHVLPTYGHARNFSGLSVDHFMRQMTVQELSREGLKIIGDAVVELAGLEGLDAHAAAVRCRLSTLESQS